MIDPIKYLYSIESKGIKLGLERTYALMKSCGNPHKKLKCLQIAGTNGKGSVAAMIAKVMQDSGMKIGLYTSPHLTNVNERIRINGESIPNSEIMSFVTQYKNVIEESDASFFETITTLAFWYFCKENVEFSVLETGLGGKFDSVTVCNPQLTVMTPISYDHKEILGDTLEKITLEKTGILKNNIPLISAKQNPTVEKIILAESEKKKCKVVLCNNQLNIKLQNLKGIHQLENATLAVEAVSILDWINLDRKTMQDSVIKTKWYGRYQIINKTPLIIFDVGHNAHGINAFIREFIKEHIEGKKYIIIALQGRKDITKVVTAIENEFDEIICTQTNERNFMSAETLGKLFCDGKRKLIKNPETAISECNNRLSKEDSLAIIGTHYLGKPIQRVYKILFDTL